ncbi:hypothetical protein T11_15025 [Trichinella zimbabwensis]|uniref:Uncharacterized protein n=1 Tax=Trichinella zimbabwensis TaxID=268475 RepID=A0A0V1GVJ6_9BILA|nr:hypothetical protein T11_15025 [Trichinella zimbabwensis]
MSGFPHLNLFMSNALSKNSFADTYGHCFFVCVGLENINESLQIVMRCESFQKQCRIALSLVDNRKRSWFNSVKAVTLILHDRRICGSTGCWARNVLPLCVSYFPVEKVSPFAQHFRLNSLVVHYDGTVKYCVRDFVKKNLDTVNESSDEVLRNSRNCFLVQLLQAGSLHSCRNHRNEPLVARLNIVGEKHSPDL